MTSFSSLQPPPAFDPLQVRGLDLPLPEVTAPRIDDIAVTVPALPPYTARQLEARFKELAREHAAVRTRDPLELVGPGDEICCDIVGYSMGLLIPSSVKTGTWLTLESEPMLPGFYEALAGQPVGSRVTVRLVFPESYPVESLRRKPALFAVDIRGAREVRMPDFEDPRFLAAFGRGSTLDEAMQSVARQVEEELSQVLLLQAQQRVLDEIAARTPVEIGEELINEEIRRHWVETEGKSLAAKRMPGPKRLEALHLWLFNPELRSEARQRLVIGLALGAICRRDSITLAAEDVEAVLRGESEASGVPFEQIAASLHGHPEVAARVDNVALHLKAVRHVMRRAKVHFEEPGKEVGQMSVPAATA